MRKGAKTKNPMGMIEYFRIRTSAKHKAALLDLSRNLSADNLYSDAIENIYRDLVIQ